VVAEVEVEEVILVDDEPNNPNKNDNQNVQARLAAAEVEEVILVDDDEEELNEPNNPNENENENQNERYRYMNSSVTIANQELELPNSHAVISRSYLSRLVESDKLSRKLKAKISNAKQYRSSPLGQ